MARITVPRVKASHKLRKKAVRGSTDSLPLVIAFFLFCFLYFAEFKEGHARPETQNPSTSERTLPIFWPEEVPQPQILPKHKVLRFVTTDTYPPFSFRTPEGVLAGFHVDLARALCEEAGIFCSLRSANFRDIIPLLTLRDADIAIAGLQVTAENRERLSFSIPYLLFPARFVTRFHTPYLSLLPPSELSDVRISVLANSPHAEYLKRFFPQARHIPYPTEDTARAALRSGTVDLHFGDALGLSFWLTGTDSQRCCRFSDGPFYAEEFFGYGLSLATRASDPELAQFLSETLRKLAEKGRLQELFERYFPLNFYDPKSLN